MYCFSPCHSGVSLQGDQTTFNLSTLSQPQPPSLPPCEDLCGVLRQADLLTDRPDEIASGAGSLSEENKTSNRGVSAAEGCIMSTVVRRRGRAGRVEMEGWVGRGGEGVNSEMQRGERQECTEG